LVAIPAGSSLACVLVRVDYRPLAEERPCRARRLSRQNPSVYCSWLSSPALVSDRTKWSLPSAQAAWGEVYRARDTRLKRDVALKILPESFAADPERRARFQREAEVLATLNHPHIAGIHGLEESGDIHALVMELVEGPTLADRIADGAIPLDEALAIAKQIAEALEAAHEQGIIHRDLKPANIKLRPDGAVKVSQSRNRAHAGAVGSFLIIWTIAQTGHLRRGTESSPSRAP
jgi:hypothetical protein